MRRLAREWWRWGVRQGRLRIRWLPAPVATASRKLDDIDISSGTSPLPENALTKASARNSEQMLPASVEDGADDKRRTKCGRLAAIQRCHAFKIIVGAVGIR